MKNKSIAYALALTTAFIWNGGELFAQSGDSDGLRILTKPKHPIHGTQFLRLLNDASGNPLSLQTSITRYRSPDKRLLVDLIAVIHVGEKDYYRKLDHQFTQYQSLLYELVAPENNRVPMPSQRSGSGTNPLKLIQGTMQNMLGLQSQLDHIDYTKKNFVHADLSPAQIKQKLQQRGETPWSFAIKAFGEAMQQQKSSPGANALAQDIQSFDQLFSVMSDSTKLKRLLAKQFASNEAMELGLGKSLNQLLITDRNEAAMKVLRQEIGEGKTRLALFYGAAHMPDFEARLTQELGLKKTRQAWVEAWDLQASANPATNNPVNSLAEMLFKMLDDASQ